LADDPLFWAAARQPELAWMTAWFPVSLLGDALQRLASKLDFLAAAEAQGLPVPRFQVCQTPTEAHSAAPGFGYPLALKTPYGFSGSAFRFVRDPDDLLRQASEFEAGQAFLVQEFVDGEVGATPVLFDHGRPMCWFSYLLLDSWPNRFAAASALTVVDHPDVESLLEGVGALTGFHGLGAIDWVRDPRTGRLLLLEFNPRPTPALYLAPLAGVDFSVALKAWLAGTATTQKPQPQLARSQPRLMFPKHLYFAFEHGNLSNFLATWRDAPWDDPLLLLAHVRRVITHFLPAEWRRRGKALKAYLSRRRPVVKEATW
jgi:predicted ATP-grasp superfamily ATP-dependent carboligase